MKVLITGASGQLGTDLARVCADSGDDFIALTRSTLDISDRDQVAHAIRLHRPESIINCAAWTAVDDCESNPERSQLINGTAVSFLAEAASEVGAHLVQLSTDYVFDGEKVEPYEIGDQTNPQSVYGTSKLAGERAALTIDASIVRTAWVFSEYGANMLATVLRLAKSHPVLRFVDDQRGNPTFSADLAVAVRNVALDRVPGLLHVTNSTTATWHEFAQAAFDVAGLDSSRVEPIATAELQPPRPAPRPANSMLANTRYNELGYPALPSLKHALGRAVPAHI